MTSLSMNALQFFIDSVAIVERVVITVVALACREVVVYLRPAIRFFLQVVHLMVARPVARGFLHFELDLAGVNLGFQLC